MKRGNALGFVNLLVSVLALAVSCAAIALVVMDRSAEPAVEPARPVDPPTPGEPPPSLAEGASVADVVARCLPTVVNISTTRVSTDQGSGNPFFDLLRPFLGGGAPRQAQSLGSGVVIDAEGVVLTNHHVVADATEIRVVLSDGRELAAQTVGSDPESDVAVMRLVIPQGQEVALSAIPYGDSSRMRQGDRVIAIGNPFGVGQTVTMGIVSATGRASMGITDYEDFIQTDAAINPGNSGGALIDMRGELVGINTAILSRTGGSHGIGFAIPSSMVRPIAEALQRDGHVTRGYLGVTLRDLNPELARQMGLTETSGVVVYDIDRNGPAASVDLRRGDRITRLDTETIQSSRQLRNLVATRGAGTAVRLVRSRAGQAGEVNVTLAQRTPTSGTVAGEPLDLSTAVDVGGLLTAPLDDALRSRFGIAAGLRQGAVVVGTREGSPGASSGIAAGEVVTEINGQPVTSPEDLRSKYERSLFVAMLGVQRGAERRIVVIGR